MAYKPDAWRVARDQIADLLRPFVDPENKMHPEDTSSQFGIPRHIVREALKQIGCTSEHSHHGCVVCLS